MAMGGYGGLIGAGIQATASHINQAGRHIYQNMSEADAKIYGERIAKLQRSLLQRQMMWATMIQGAQVQQERQALDIGLVDRAEGKQAAATAKSEQQSRQKMGDVMNMINRTPQLRTQTINNLLAVQQRGF